MGKPTKVQVRFLRILRDGWKVTRMGGGLNGSYMLCGKEDEGGRKKPPTSTSLSTVTALELEDRLA